ncbi:MCE family protein [Amycolatopsis cynarae]|uniref:MCE family protein n=1 Tax=Amycolatopsis cynarae TaxID=2995223 RepID=A0ABY7BAN9_9PSEU|nr:MCE family protein [Amycolatopsis sp. HUAS 11-8]WAL69435.1 MCE family protein [Amycolatopsis sp. HUAS 11-8]
MSERGRRWRYQALGLVFLVVLAVLGWLAVAGYQKRFTPVVSVVLLADRAGTQLKANADVKVRGVLVGSVREVKVQPGGVEVGLALDPGQAAGIPGNVSARLLPKTLFGQRYVSLVLPERPSGPIAAGTVIRQDHSRPAVEVEQALRDLLPVLQAVQPQKLAGTLGAIAQALDGRGRPLGETLVTLKDYLAQLNPELPQLRGAISKLADTAQAYTAAAPDIVDALDDLRTTAGTLTRQRGDLADLFASVTATANDATRFLDDSGHTLVALSSESLPTLRLFAEYAPEFPCLAEAAAGLKPKVDKVLGAGTAEPGLHVEIKVRQPPKGPAVPPGGSGPRCASGGSPAPAGSPAGQQLIAELLAGAEGVTPQEIPGWAGLLAGPVLRGTEVTLR